MFRRSNLFIGSIFVTIAFFFMAVFGILTRQATLNGSFLWVSFFTYLTAAVVMIPFVLKDGICETLKTSRIRTHLARAFFGLGASFLYTVSINYTSIVDATLLLNTAPIFIPIIAIVWLGHRSAARLWIAVALGFVGIMIILRPEVNRLAQYGNLIGLASGVSLAIAFLSVKALTATEPLKKILTHFFWLCTLIQLPLLYWAGPVPPWDSLLLTVGASLAYMLQQVFLVKGYRYGDAQTLGIFQYTVVVFVALIDWAFWGRVPSLEDLPGIALIVLSGVIIQRH